MRIYRVENTAGEGPYANRSPWESDVPHDLEHGRPHPAAEMGRDWTDNWNAWIGIETRFEREYGEGAMRFGFDSTAALERWFREEERAALRAHGYAMVVFECDDALVTRLPSQCVFPRPKATSVRIQPIP